MWVSGVTPKTLNSKTKKLFVLSCRIPWSPSLCLSTSVTFCIRHKSLVKLLKLSCIFCYQLYWLFCSCSNAGEVQLWGLPLEGYQSITRLICRDTQPSTQRNWVTNKPDRINLDPHMHTTTHANMMRTCTSISTLPAGLDSNQGTSSCEVLLVPSAHCKLQTMS